MGTSNPILHGSCYFSLKNYSARKWGYSLHLFAVTFKIMILVECLVHPWAITAHSALFPKLQINKRTRKPPDLNRKGRKNREIAHIGQTKENHPWNLYCKSFILKHLSCQLTSQANEKPQRSCPFPKMDPFLSK